MFKKIEIWILYLVLLLGIPITISFGFLVRHEMLGGKRFGSIPKVAVFLSKIPSEVKDLLISNQKVQDRFPSLDGFRGTPSSQESYLLLSKYEEDSKESIVELIDLMNFKVLHTWNPNLNQFNKLVKKNDEFRYLDRDHNNSRARLFHPKLTQDGGLLFHLNGSPLIKIDSCSNLIFQNQHDQFHHSIELDLEGNIWSPTRMYPQFLPIKKVGRNIWEHQGYWDDAITKLSPNGEILFQKSVSQIFIENDLEYLLFSVGDRAFSKNPIHLNDIQPVDFDGKFWKKGDVFLSLRHQSMVLLFRPNTGEIVWKWTGPFFHQHDIDILDEHRISVFNNNSKDFSDGDVVDGNNEVIIYNFKTNAYSSYLNASLIKNDVRTITQGRSEILKNGDLYVEDSNSARTLYFNSDGSLRWTHVNRGENGKIYRVAWSRILYNKEDIQIVKNFLESKGYCND